MRLSCDSMRPSERGRARCSDCCLHPDDAPVVAEVTFRTRVRFYRYDLCFVCARDARSVARAADGAGEGSVSDVRLIWTSTTVNGEVLA